MKGLGSQGSRWWDGERKSS